MNTAKSKFGSNKEWYMVWGSIERRISGLNGCMGYRESARNTIGNEKGRCLY